eukprot:GHVQ01042376.1.p1 GENE.GHVQ01042376.1~~GHVQ01042376.1.p1  ORF type:complete len:595 (-),score=119.83 GHVQ01042376.1:1033-2817(-)
MPSSRTQTPRKQQFFQTRICPWFFKGRCDRGRLCHFAHSQEEIRDAPDLSCTSLCPNIKKSGNCNANSCKYAHTSGELRATGEMFRTALCVKWLVGRCNAGANCRHAHGTSELRQEISDISPDEGTLHKYASMPCLTEPSSTAPVKSSLSNSSLSTHHTARGGRQNSQKQNNRNQQHNTAHTVQHNQQYNISHTLQHNQQYKVSHTLQHNQQHNISQGGKPSAPGNIPATRSRPHSAPSSPLPSTLSPSTASYPHSCLPTYPISPHPPPPPPPPPPNTGLCRKEGMTTNHPPPPLSPPYARQNSSPQLVPPPSVSYLSETPGYPAEQPEMFSTSNMTDGCRQLLHSDYSNREHRLFDRSAAGIKSADVMLDYLSSPCDDTSSPMIKIIADATNGERTSAWATGAPSPLITVSNICHRTRLVDETAFPALTASSCQQRGEPIPHRRTSFSVPPSSKNNRDESNKIYPQYPLPPATIPPHQQEETPTTPSSRAPSSPPLFFSRPDDTSSLLDQSLPLVMSCRQVKEDGRGGAEGQSTDEMRRAKLIDGKQMNIIRGRGPLANSSQSATNMTESDSSHCSVLFSGPNIWGGMLRPAT